MAPGGRLRRGGGWGSPPLPSPRCLPAASPDSGKVERSVAGDGMPKKLFLDSVYPVIFLTIKRVTDELVRRVKEKNLK